MGRILIASGKSLFICLRSLYMTYGVSQLPPTGGRHLPGLARLDLYICISTLIKGREIEDIDDNREQTARGILPVYCYADFNSMILRFRPPFTLPRQ